MAGINQGTPETAIGEPIRLGDNDEFEIEQHPISDRLIIRDTVNGKVAYVQKERGGQIGGDGVLIKALKESKPMADDGRTYDTIQEAESQASGWVFVPPGTYNEEVKINTEGLHLKGSGYTTLVNGDNGDTIVCQEDGIIVSDLRVSGSAGRGIYTTASNTTFDSVIADSTQGVGIDFAGPNGLAVNCRTENTDTIAIAPNDENCIVASCVADTTTDSHGIFNGGGTGNNIIANNVVISAMQNGIKSEKDNDIIIGNRVINSGLHGIRIIGSNTIVANNRISDSTNTDIDDVGTGTLLDANLTGASN